MTSATMTDKFLNSVMVTLIARATLLALPLVVTFMTYITTTVYSDITRSLEAQALQITEIKSELQEHQFRLDSDKIARDEQREGFLKQLTGLDTQLDVISDKANRISDAVIRVQTIIETRLPPKSGQLNSTTGVQ